MPPLETPFLIVNPQAPVAALIQQSKKRRDKLFNDLRRAYEHGNKEGVRKLRDKWFRNDSVKIAFLYKAGVRHVSYRDWETEARLFGPLHRVDHVVDWYRRPKTSGGFRVVCDLSHIIKAAHYKVAEALLAQFDLPDFIFNVRPLGEKGRDVGRDRLMETLIAKLRSGYAHYR